MIVSLFFSQLCILLTSIFATPLQAQVIEEEWAKRYHYTSDLSYAQNFANDIVVDNQGNVYVTGHILIGNNNNTDNTEYATIKYDPKGNELWVKRYSGNSGNDAAVAVALDGQGNLYVTGYSFVGNSLTDSDYITIKYDAQGNELWVKRYATPNNFADRPTTMEIDSKGNLYITGSSTVKYDAQGNLLWATPSKNNTIYSDLSVDNQGNVHVVGGLTAVKYNTQGNLAWEKQYTYLSRNTIRNVFFNGIKNDASGNVYVIGTSTYFDGRWDLYFKLHTFKFDPQGNLVWNKEELGGYSAPSDSDYQTKDLVLDVQGNIYMTGLKNIYKYNPQGNLLWKKSTGDIDGTLLNVDNKGNVYLVAAAGIIKYNSNGDEVWTKLLSGYTNSYQMASTLDTQENIYITGTSYSTGYQTDYLTVKLTQEPIVCSATGSILQELWLNVPGSLVTDIPVNTAPSSTAQLTSFESKTNQGTSYGERIRGYLCVPTSGNYTFYIAGDDKCELWLSTDDDPAKKVKIASVSAYTGVREWTKYPSQKSVAIALQAGKKYYIEALHKEDKYSDNLAVGWSKPNSSIIEVIPGSNLSPFTAPVVATGKITREYWANVTGGLVTDIPLNTAPTSVTEITAFETTTNQGTSYGQRIRGYVHPQVSGNYTFYLSGDDRCELWLSTDETPAKKVKIASVGYFTGVREWIKYSSQKSVAIALQAGKKYYIEALHKEDKYSDNLAVGWSLPNQTNIAVIAGTYLSPFLPSPAARIAAREESFEGQVSVYPNPFDGKLTLVTSQPGKFTVSLTDNLGRVVYQSSIQGAGTETVLDLGQLKAGLYLAKISAESGQTQVMRVVKK